MSISKKVLSKYFDKKLPDSIKMIDQKSGRLLAENGGWAVANQNVMYTLTLQYLNEDSVYCKDFHILELISKMGDALRDHQQPDGKFEFVKIDGSRWGMVYMCWPLYYWLESFRKLKGFLSDHTKKNWEVGLRLAYEGVAKELLTLGVHNIPAWNAMGLSLASQVFNKPEWFDVGKDMIYKTVDTMQEHGYWPEHGGPTTLYNSTYVHSLGLFYLLHQDNKVKECLEKAINFHVNFTYPDGTFVETIDGRVKYHDHCINFGYPGFMATSQGKSFMNFCIEEIIKKEEVPSVQLASIIEYYHLFDQGENPKLVPQRKESFTHNYLNHALLLKNEDWFACMSGYVTPTNLLHLNARNRWSLDRQNLMSIWHKSYGLLIGGGSSKNQPEVSTFFVVQGRSKYLEPCEAVVNEAKKQIEYLYGSQKCSVQIEVIDKNKLKINYTSSQCSDTLVPIKVSVPIFNLGNKTISTSLDKILPLTSENEIIQSFKESNSFVLIDKIKITLPHEKSLFRWPIYPFNPYAINNLTENKNILGAISFDLSPAGETKSILIEYQK